MSATVFTGGMLETDGRGFLISFDQWDKNLAEHLAAEEGLSLNECHWAVINFLREYYSEFEHPPSPRLIIRGVGDQLTVNARCTRKTLDALFPSGGCKQACRIAGLPDYYCHAC